MVLELKVPHGADLESLRPLLPVFLSYILSFIYLGIYWNNHHHMLQAAHQINGKISCGRICIFCSGSRSSRSSQDGWAKIISRSFRPPFTEWFCSARQSLTLFSANSDNCRTGRRFQTKKAIGRDVKGKISPSFISPPSLSPSSTNGSPTCFMF